MSPILGGAGVLVTRPAAQAARLAQLVREAGGEPVLFPALEIEALASGAIPEGAFDLVIVVSPNAARIGMPALSSRHVPGPHARIAAIGPGTVAELQRQGYRDVVSPRAGHDSEALLAELSGIVPSRVLIVRGQGGRELLADALRTRGAAVEYFECYRRVRPQGNLDALVAGPTRDAVRACLATSSNIVDNLFDMAGATAGGWLRGKAFFVSHARVAATAFRHGASTVFVAGNGDDALVDGLKTWFARQRPVATHMQANPSEAHGRTR